MGDYTKAREDKDIDFRVTKESEQMLVKDRVPPSSRVKEGCIKVSVCEKYCDAGSKHG